MDNRLGRLRLVVPLLDNPKGEPQFGSLYFYMDGRTIDLDLFVPGTGGEEASKSALHVIAAFCIEQGVPHMVRRPQMKIGQAPGPEEIGLTIFLAKSVPGEPSASAEAQGALISVSPGLPQPDIDPTGTDGSAAEAIIDERWMASEHTLRQEMRAEIKDRLSRIGDEDQKDM